MMLDRLRQDGPCRSLHRSTHVYETKDKPYIERATMLP
jgi:hypothetical protein